MTGITKSSSLSSEAFHRRVIRPSRLRTRMLGFVVTAIACHLGALTPHGMADLRLAQRGDISLSVTLLSKDGTLSAYEPLLARIEWLNQTKETILLLIGTGRALATHLEVRNSDGETVAAMPRPQPSRTGGSGAWRLKPGEVRTGTWVITGLYQFRQPGEYTIRLELLEWVKELPVLAQAGASIRVVPFDASRLEARCEELFQPLRGYSSSKTNIPTSARTKALYSVRHDIVLPYLDWIARERHSSYACLAMRRIGTERARELLGTLAARDNEAGEVARKALKMDLESTVRDVVW